MCKLFKTIKDGSYVKHSVLGCGQIGLHGSDKSIVYFVGNSCIFVETENLTLLTGIEKRLVKKRIAKERNARKVKGKIKKFDFLCK